MTYEREQVVQSARNYLDNRREPLPHHFGLVQAVDELGTENARLRAELKQWTTWGVIEVAIRNPSVSEYMRHWEGRATKAEAEVERLRAKAKHYEVESKKLRTKLADIRKMDSKAFAAWQIERKSLHAALAEKDKAVAKMIKACSDSGEMWTALCRVNLLLQGPDPAARAQTAANLVRSAIEKLEGQP